MILVMNRMFKNRKSYLKGNFAVVFLILINVKIRNQIGTATTAPQPKNLSALGEKIRPSEVLLNLSAV